MLLFVHTSTLVTLILSYSWKHIFIFYAITQILEIIPHGKLLYHIHCSQYHGCWWLSDLLWMSTRFISLNFESKQKKCIQHIYYSNNNIFCGLNLDNRKLCFKTINWWGGGGGGNKISVSLKISPNILSWMKLKGFRSHFTDVFFLSMAQLINLLRMEIVDHVPIRVYIAYWRWSQIQPYILKYLIWLLLILNSIGAPCTNKN